MISPNICGETAALGCPIHVGASEEIAMLETPRIVQGDAQLAASFPLTIPREKVHHR
jgi:hypothetical protein